MNTSTAITTAARRIAAKTNATNSETKLYFDAAGQRLDAHAKGMWYTLKQPTDGRVIVTTIGAGHGHMTYREAQDLIDADEYARSQSEMYGDTARGFYLQQLATEREIAAGRVVL